ncbi:MAG: M15 family metallopeptidase [Desulfovibrionaceae bacterium]
MRIFSCCALALVLVSALFPAAVWAENTVILGPELKPIDLHCLQVAYGENIAARGFFTDPTVLESLADSYPLEPQRPNVHVGQHPGRVRSYALLRALYGKDKMAVQAHVQAVSAFGQRVYLSPAAAQAFRRVVQTLEALTLRKPYLRAYMLPMGGFAWRSIAGENRLSPHSFGIAVDLNPAKGIYWRWSTPQKRQSIGAAARAAYPSEIVAAFEAEGFIWGGKWYEYDLMHFEYRPEIICKAKRKASEQALPSQSLKDPICP